jgi:hypothetical protein
MKQPPYFRAWIIFFLVATVGGAIAGAVAGGILGMIMAMMGAKGQVITYGGALIGFLVGMPISFFTFRWTITSFIIPALQEGEASGAGHTNEPPELPPVGPYEPPRQD